MSLVRKCETCGGSLEGRRPDARYCSRKCKGKARNWSGTQTPWIRFKRQNPAAPECCESCGESRVLDVAHKPHSKRNGAIPTKANTRWPDMVWVLCPLCHALLDRLGVPPADLGLEE